MASPGDTSATFCAALVDEWARQGVAHAVVAPGSRSTPLAVAIAREPRLRLHVFHDEHLAARCSRVLRLDSGRLVSA